MKAYLSYSEYVGYGGDLPETAFPIEEFKAQKQIDYMTDSRVAAMETVPEEVKLCLFEIIRYNTRFSAAAQIDNPVIASFNTDGYSESYGSAVDQATAARRELVSLIVHMLHGVTDDDGTPLLYRGVYL